MLLGCSAGVTSVAPHVCVRIEVDTLCVRVTCVTCVSERELLDRDASRMEASNALMLVGIPRPVSFASSWVVTYSLCSRPAPGDACIAYATGLAGGGDVASRENSPYLSPEHAGIVYGIGS